jgi:hypothetical protein
MSQGFWPNTFKNAAYLINHSPTTTLDNKMPYEAWMGKQLNIKHLRTFSEVGMYMCTRNTKDMDQEIPLVLAARVHSAIEEL